MMLLNESLQLKVPLSFFDLFILGKHTTLLIICNAALLNSMSNYVVISLYLQYALSARNTGDKKEIISYSSL